MTTTVIYADEPHDVAGASRRGEALWLSLADLHAATGWELKPQGLCREERCVPLPPDRKAEFLDADGMFDVTAFARYVDQPVVADLTHGVWMFGEAPSTRRDALAAGEAPDFRLPDLDGKLHALSDYRGRKVLLLSWASW